MLARGGFAPPLRARRDVGQRYCRGRYGSGEEVRCFGDFEPGLRTGQPPRWPGLCLSGDETSSTVRRALESTSKPANSHAHSPRSRLLSNFRPPTRCLRPSPADSAARSLRRGAGVIPARCRSRPDQRAGPQGSPRAAAPSVAPNRSDGARLNADRGIEGRAELARPSCVRAHPFPLVRRTIE